jgi:hypothetical protein
MLAACMHGYYDVLGLLKRTWVGVCARQCVCFEGGGVLLTHHDQHPEKSCFARTSLGISAPFNVAVPPRPVVVVPPTAIVIPPTTTTTTAAATATTAAAATTTTLSVNRQSTNNKETCHTH